MNLAVARPLSAEPSIEARSTRPLIQGGAPLSEVQREGEVIERILLEAEDRSSLAPELLRRALDAGVWYHFNPFRTSAVRVLDLPPHCRILEIGCGAGVVTRYLAEQGFRVTAVEPTPELARCARMRCQGLLNVDVVESYLDVVMVDEKFDVVVCLDPTLVESEFCEPGLELFAMCRKVLKPAGSLILAVGNPISAVAEAHIELSRDHVRGRGAPLGSLRDSLASAGFPNHDTFLCFPHHAAPQVLIEPLHSRAKRINWLAMIRDTFQGAPSGMEQFEKWWRTIHTEYLDSALAPGWVLVAHAHQVHAPLWGGWALAQISSVRESEGDSRSLDNAGNLRSRIVLSDPELVSRISSRCAPKVSAHQEILDQIAAGQLRANQLSKEHQRLRSLVAHKRLATRERLHAERRARKGREAELELVLTHSREVGAVCGEVKKDKLKLEEQVAALQERYVASEERLLDLAAKVHEAELELSKARSSWLWRARSLFGKLAKAAHCLKHRC
jgi:SAM-dependent methyltransferase